MANSPSKIISEITTENPNPNPTITVSTTIKAQSSQELTSPSKAAKSFTGLVDYSDEEESEGFEKGNQVVEEPQIEGGAKIDCENEVGIV